MLANRLMVTWLSALVIGLLGCRAAAAQERKGEEGGPGPKRPPARDADRRPVAPPGDVQQPGQEGTPGEFGPPPHGFGPPRPGAKPPFGRPGVDDPRRLGPPDRRGPHDEHDLAPKPPLPGGMPGGTPGRMQRMPAGPVGPPRWPHHDWGSLERNDPEMFKLFKEEMELEHQSRDLAGQFRQSPSPKRDEVKKQLQKIVSQQFEVRQQRRQLELKRLEEELQRLREAIEARNKARQQLVEKRVSELLGQDEDVGF